MDFVAIILFLALYYLRPQEWFPAFIFLHPIQLLSVLAIWAMVQKENYKRLVRTPLDWLILFYFIWTLIAGFQPRITFPGIQSVLLFYFVAVCALDTIPRITKFLGWWCVFIFIIAFLAVVSTLGFDPLQSQDLTQGVMKGRLVLNLSIFDNPNTLAHSIIPAIPLFYYLFYWKQLTAKAMAVLLIVPLYCIYLTQSKGAFLCGFATLLATLTFGRSRIWQIVILVVAIGFGYSALFMLPRMNELHNSKTDPAIQGRVAALTYGLYLMRANPLGIGLGNFQDAFLRHGPLEKKVAVRIVPAKKVPTGGPGEYREIDSHLVRVTTFKHYSKATHGSYNQNGAELGYVGLFLFVGIIYCCIRTLLLVKSQDNSEERIRRALFAMVVAYAASSWMVDFTYRPTFFMMVAAISAFHRHLLRKEEEANKPVEPVPIAPGRPWLRRLPPIGIPGISLPGLAAPATAGASAFVTPRLAPAALANVQSPGEASAASGAGPLLAPGRGSASLRPAIPAFATGSGSRALPWDKPNTSFQESLLKRFKWTRLGLTDLLIMWFLTYLTIRYWEHLIATM